MAKTPDDQAERQREEEEHNRRQHEEAERHRREELQHEGQRQEQQRQEQERQRLEQGTPPHLRPGQPPGQPANLQGQPQPPPEAQRRPQAEPGGPRPPGSPPGVSPDNVPESTGRYRLLAPHVIEGVVYEAGTEVGTDTGVPYALEPSTQMEAVDDAGKERINKRHQLYYGKDAPWHDPKNPEGQRREHDREEMEKQREEEKGQEPVSHQQAFERGAEEFKGEKVTGPPPAPRPAMNKGGDTSPGMGPATPQEPKDEDIRPRTPLKDQMP